MCVQCYNILRTDWHEWHLVEFKCTRPFTVSVLWYSDTLNVHTVLTPDLHPHPTSSSYTAKDTGWSFRWSQYFLICSLIQVTVNIKMLLVLICWGNVSFSLCLCETLYLTCTLFSWMGKQILVYDPDSTLIADPLYNTEWMWVQSAVVACSQVMLNIDLLS